MTTVARSTRLRVTISVPKLGVREFERRLLELRGKTWRRPSDAHAGRTQLLDRATRARYGRYRPPGETPNRAYWYRAAVDLARAKRTRNYAEARWQLSEMKREREWAACVGFKLP